MKILVGCEESGVVRRAFRKRGHDSYSCDLLEARDGSTDHFQQDIVALLKSYPDKYFDIIILHPDCTKVAVCGNRTWAGTEDRENQVKWILNLWGLAKEKSVAVALENPGSVIWPRLREIGADVQFIQPWQFGHTEQKKTGLALHNLPRLVETKNVYKEMMLLPPSKRERVFRMAPSSTRKRDRSETYEGIAEAMAQQWGSLI